MNDLEARSAELREELTQCRDPQRNTVLKKELQATMQAIHDSQPAPDHTEEIESLRSGGQVGAADLLERQTRIQAAQARLHAAQDGPPRQLEAAEKALQAAHAPTAGQSSAFEKRKLLDEANEMRAQAALLSRSPITEERVRGLAMAEQVKDKLDEWESFRATH